MIGERIQKRLEATRESQAGLARAVGLRQPTIARLISGDSRSSAHLHKIARHLGTTVEYLVGETDDPEGGAVGHYLTDEELTLVTRFRSMPLRNKEATLKMVEYFSE